MKIAIILLLLSGCGGTVPEVRADVPSVLKSCPAPPPAVPEPRPPRSFETVVAWAALVEERRAQSAWAAEVCRRRLRQLNELMEQRG